MLKNWLARHWLPIRLVSTWAVWASSWTAMPMETIKCWFQPGDQMSSISVIFWRIWQYVTASKTSSRLFHRHRQSDRRSVQILLVTSWDSKWHVLSITKHWILHCVPRLKCQPWLGFLNSLNSLQLLMPRLRSSKRGESAWFLGC